MAIRVDKSCTYCMNYDTDNKSSLSRTEYWCRELRKYTEPRDGRYCNYIEAKPGYTFSSSCFITTIVVHILGKSDDDWVLVNLRNLRDNHMQDASGFELLKEYDVVGPQIATMIENSENAYNLSDYLYKCYMTQCAKMVECGFYKSAIIIYKEMVDQLKTMYKISLNLNEYEYTDNIDSSRRGHGTARVHKIIVNN